mmetsp:Transcript_9934/g.15026  ORF Transcript_9934/g.15026 Transcript_9934/m.15026 type:complete len:620 (+) Transcript_9934:120-1979(+)|eukprot:CAMPEP_0196140274 /NCGR_PEP_ID=MMETSP0910-20130528/7239_1 /TAXON_ID=49265 /ORGANISM="Thalassiosira rotula, Strain GSO102" /LENGTH=619 /DNA_ID=CAMNT_0041401111 /DNA_START=262 /DNA_END=2121 /DNA_ORIENTATION=-
MTILSTGATFSSMNPSKTSHWGATNESSNTDYTVTKRFSQNSTSTLRCSIVSRESVPMHHAHGFQRPDTTDTALSLTAVSTAILTEDAGANDSNTSQRKRYSLSKINIGGLRGILKLSSSVSRRCSKHLSEPQLRKKLKKIAERGDWDAARKLINGYEFLVIPHTQQTHSEHNDSRASTPDRKHVVADRRPSYGSRSGGARRSFTGGESVAAAAAIQAALIEESESSSADDSPEHGSLPDIGDNILHDLCRCQPPQDVVETLLCALRHRRRGGTTSGIDDHGRTPLHLAAMTGASPDVVDALVRADPCPASRGDEDGRTPLHHAVKFLASGGYHHFAPVAAHSGRKSSRSSNKSTIHQGRLMLSPEEALERTYQTVRILKDTMHAYPGKVSFKDEDTLGYSPLDYAVESNITKTELIQTLIRRKGKHCFVALESNISDSQDSKVLRQLEQDEIEARRQRLENFNKRQAEGASNDLLFDVFGIEQSVIQQAVDDALSLCKQNGHCDDKTSDKKELEQQQVSAEEEVRNDDAIYNQHLQNYIDDFMGDLEGCENLDYFEEDSFDILDDPSEAQQRETLAMIDEESIIANGEIPPLADVIVDKDDDCVSVVSEISLLNLSLR